MDIPNKYDTKLKRRLKYGLASVLYALVGHQQGLPEKTVLRSFATKYPKALYTTWRQMENTVWEAAFFWQEKERTALFDENGQWLVTRTYLPLGNVPTVVRKSFNVDNQNRSPHTTFLLERPEGSLYEFQLKQGRVRYGVAGNRMENSR